MGYEAAFFGIPLWKAVSNTATDGVEGSASMATLMAAMAGLL